MGGVPLRQGQELRGRAYLHMGTRGTLWPVAVALPPPSSSAFHRTQTEEQNSGAHGI